MPDYYGGKLSMNNLMAVVQVQERIGTNSGFRQGMLPLSTPVWVNEYYWENGTMLTREVPGFVLDWDEYRDNRGNMNVSYLVVTPKGQNNQGRTQLRPIIRSEVESFINQCKPCCWECREVFTRFVKEHLL